ncbi:MAG: DUF5986 family protein [Firmicutes bacterium]|nr:DUF5986 family protein [Bacillota bacterium]
MQIEKINLSDEACVALSQIPKALEYSLLIHNADMVTTRNAMALNNLDEIREELLKYDSDSFIVMPKKIVNWNLVIMFDRESGYILELASKNLVNNLRLDKMSPAHHILAMLGLNQDAQPDIEELSFLDELGLDPVVQNARACKKQNKLQGITADEIKGYVIIEYDILHAVGKLRNLKATLWSPNMSTCSSVDLSKLITYDYGYDAGEPRPRAKVKSTRLNPVDEVSLKIDVKEDIV